MFQWNGLRWITFLIAVVLVGGLVAVLTQNAKDNGSEVQSASADDPITLELWDFPHMPETTQYILRAIAEFEKEHGVRVRYTRLPWQDGQQKVTLAVLGGQPPDVCCQVSNNISGFVAQGALEPLNDALAPELDDYYQSYLDAVSY